MIWQPGRTLADIEKQAITEALRHFDGNKTKACEALGISIRTIRNLVHEYEIHEFKPDPLKWGFNDFRRNY